MLLESFPLVYQTLDPVDVGGSREIAEVRVTEFIPILEFRGVIIPTLMSMRMTIPQNQ
jgi:hypothetical protein